MQTITQKKKKKQQILKHNPQIEIFIMTRWSSTDFISVQLYWQYSWASEENYQNFVKISKENLPSTILLLKKKKKDFPVPSTHIRPGNGFPCVVLLTLSHVTCINTGQRFERVQNDFNTEPKVNFYTLPLFFDLFNVRSLITSTIFLKCLTRIESELQRHLFFVIVI